MLIFFLIWASFYAYDMLIYFFCSLIICAREAKADIGLPVADDDDDDVDANKQ